MNNANEISTQTVYKPPPSNMDNGGYTITALSVRRPTLLLVGEGGRWVVSYKNVHPKN
jgi:hypothetical protein